MDLGDGLGVSGGGPRIPQQLPAHAREKGDLGRANVGIPKKNDGRSGIGLAEKRETGTHAVRQKQVRRPLQELAVLPQTENVFYHGSKRESRE